MSFTYCPSLVSANSTLMNLDEAPSGNVWATHFITNDGAQDLFQVNPATGGHTKIDAIPVNLVAMSAAVDMIPPPPYPRTDVAMYCPFFSVFPSHAYPDARPGMISVWSFPPPWSPGGRPRRYLFALEVPLRGRHIVNVSYDC